MVQRDSLLRFTCSCGGRVISLFWLFDDDLALRCDTELAIYHDLFARCDAFLNHDQIALALAQRNGALFGRHIRFDHVNVGTSRGYLWRRRWDEYRALNRCQQQTNVDEATGPKPVIGIWKRRAQRHLSGFSLHGVVDEGESP